MDYYKVDPNDEHLINYQFTEEDLKENDSKDGYRLLKPDSEKIAFKKYNLLRKQLKSCLDSDLIDMSQLGSLYDQYVETKKYIASCNIRLVFLAVRNYKGMRPTYVSEEDEFEIGYVTLMRSIDKFDHNLNFKFSTYGYSSMMRNLFTMMTQQHGAGLKTWSKSTQLDPEVEDSLTASTSTYNEVEKQLDVHTFIHKVLKSLNQKQLAIIKHRFGIDEEELTLKELGAKIGLTRERVRQIQDKTLSILRRRFRENEEGLI